MSGGLFFANQTKKSRAFTTTKREIKKHHDFGLVMIFRRVSLFFSSHSCCYRFAGLVA